MGTWALLSVTDKTGLEVLAQHLLDQGLGLLATSSTADYLERCGITVTRLEDLTGFGDLMGGRVKTLHPKVYAGILSRETPSDREDRERMDAPLIDVVVVNLYPFEARWQEQATLDALVEEIDIGGVSLIRAAAKNYERVTVLVSPTQYGPLIEGSTRSRADRKAYAEEAFGHVARYDALIAEAFHGEDPGWPDQLTLTGHRQGTLRYGENPHQSGAFYALPGGRGFAEATLHQGKPLSYNNYADADTAWALASAFTEPVAVVVKHQTPAAVAVAEHIDEAYRRAHEADPVSIFGGIVAVNRPIGLRLAERLSEIFLEVVLAPEVSPEALTVFARKKNLRVMTMEQAGTSPVDLRAIYGGFLVQQRDRLSDMTLDGWKQVAGPDWKSKASASDVLLAFRTVAGVKSNAIVVARDGVTWGIGGGQTNRVDAAREALERAGDHARGAILASDAFFPFGDVMDLCHQYGVEVVIEPGGSVRDQESIDRAGAHDIALVFTGERHFRH